ncbi:hypothetical protein PybrP1_008288 [[Pythium] brassicae (nom. inval.)]|nr:hypothetical protein PybrP1_008288 [[Pythium] brassicae (nom. inval.)]
MPSSTNANTTTLVRPPALQPGDTIAFVAPSSGLAAFVPHRVERARQELECLGFRVKIYPSVLRTPQQNHELERRCEAPQGRGNGGSISVDSDSDTITTSEQVNGSTDDPSVGDECDATTASTATPLEFYSSASAQTRAHDLMDAFRDPSVKAILCTVGGLTSHELLEYLDFDVVRAHPTIFCGYSDATALHLALFARAGLCSFYGPSAVCQFGEFPAPLAYTLEHFFKAVGAVTAEPVGAIAPSLEWTDDKTANWLTRADVAYVDKMRTNDDYVWLREGRARGRILGGCLPVLLNVRGTAFMPDLTGAVLLLETPEGAAFDQPMPLAHVNAVLGALRADGTFRRIRGLVLGRAFALSAPQVAELHRLVLHHTRGAAFPILYGADVGHTNPLVTIPLGCEVLLDSAAGEDGAQAFVVLESGVV